MVNSKFVAFKVDKQVPLQGPHQAPTSIVLNCRKGGGKRRSKAGQAADSHPVSVTKLLNPGKKRQRDEEDQDRKCESQSSKSPKLSVGTSPHSGQSSQGSRALSPQTPSSTPGQSSIGLGGSTPVRPLKRTRLSRRKPFTGEWHTDIWWHVMTVSNPAQLLQFREHIRLCFHLLDRYPKIWEHSRVHTYGDDVPNPPSEINEFQYASLRHGTGCMSCHKEKTRKPYWAFLRRWCKDCLKSKLILDHEAIPMMASIPMPSENGEELSSLMRCLPSGVLDTWGNFLGVGPATTHSLKTVYVRDDVEKLVAECTARLKANDFVWTEEAKTWIREKTKLMEERRAFAQQIERWEEKSRQAKSLQNHNFKESRRTYFAQRANEFDPPMLLAEMQGYRAFDRSIKITKPPNLSCWQMLKPKLEVERAARLAAAQEVAVEKRSGIPIDFLLSGSQGSRAI
jgi:hypothetical protein